MRKDVKKDEKRCEICADISLEISAIRLLQLGYFLSAASIYLTSYFHISCQPIFTSFLIFTSHVNLFSHLIALISKEISAHISHLLHLFQHTSICAGSLDHSSTHIFTSIAALAAHISIEHLGIMHSSRFHSDLPLFI